MQKSMNSQDQIAVTLIDNELPEGWESTSLKTVATLKKGKKPYKVDKTTWPGAVPYIDIEAFEKGNIRRYADQESSALVNEGDIIVVWDGARCGHVGKAPERGALGSTLGTIQPILVYPDYILRFLQLSYETINTNPRGIGIPHVEPELFWNLEIPLAPLAEQKRIVAKVEELLTRVNATKERLAKVAMILKSFRQAVLAAACSGRLTEDWRENIQKDSAEDLVLKILNRRRSQLEIKGKVSSRTRYKEPIEPAYQLAFEIPDAWCLATVDQLTLLVTKGSSPKWQGFEYKESGLPFVRSQNVLWGNFDLSDVAYLPVVFNESHKNSIIHQGDILLNLVGASVGRSSIATEAIEGANCNQAVAIIRLVPDGMLNKFLMYFFLSPYAQEHIHESKADVARANFNLDDIRPMVVPVPPLTEQTEIVRRVEAMFKLADAVEKRIDAAKVRAEKLTQAILAKAFRGDLVPTEADLARREGRSYEPASDLLARIKSDGESKGGSKSVNRIRRSQRRLK
ncbi:MAG: restriction endonuclease subunit S [Thermodesulfobacteriota bacterium]|nr:restriction endonuclease subunit S [Thermodesulfobacteriota bacterium]